MEVENIDSEKHVLLSNDQNNAKKGEPSVIPKKSGKLDSAAE